MAGDDAPNLFELTSEDVQVTYSTSSFDGTPRFTYSDPDGQKDFAGDEIESADTALGSEVTVTLEAVPDLHTITFTLVLPDFRMPEYGDVAFTTFAITTTNLTSIAGPREGPGQTYEAVVLEGTAKSVEF
jgi:hypothetical protein